MRSARARSYVRVGATLAFAFAGPLIWGGRMAPSYEPARRHATPAVDAGRMQLAFHHGLIATLYCESLRLPASASTSMTMPPKSGVTSMRPVLSAVTTTAVKLSAAAANASQIAVFCAGVGGTLTRRSVAQDRASHQR